MPLNFPSTGLTANQTTYSYSGNTWIWNGFAWDSVFVNGITGTANEIEVTGLTSLVVGLPDNVTISGNLNVDTILPRASASELQLGNSSKPIRIGDFQNSNNGNYLSIDDTGDSISVMALHGVVRITSSEGEIQLGDTVEGNGSGALIDIQPSPISQDNVIYIKPVQGGSNYITINPSELNYGTLTLTGQNARIGSLTAGSIYASNIVSSWNGQTGAVGFSNYVSSINGRTGAFGLTGTANEIEITGATSFVVGLPDNVQIASSLSINGGTAWHSGNDGATSQLDAGYLYGIPGNIFSSNLATGLLYGGILSINAGNSGQFDITAGKGQIHFAGASHTAEPNPTLQFITWTGATGVTLSGLTSQDTTWLYFDSSGVLHQQATYYTDDQVENNIVIGALVHPTRSYISLARTIPNVGYATDKQYEQFIRAFGPMKVDGHTIQANGANLSLNRTSGTAFILGRNYKTDPNNPSVVSDNAKTEAQIWRYYRGATAGTFVTQTGFTGIDPANYDNGSGTLAAVSPSTPFTIQRVFFYPNTPDVLGVYYGRSQYASLPEAAKNIHLEDFTEITNTKTNAVLTAFVIAKYNTTDLAADILADNARIIQAGQFRTTSSGGGSVATNLDDLTDVTITSVQDDDVLIYDTATSQWLNTPLAHIGVRSVNGLTGAIVSVAVTGSNTFTGLQTMTAGITASHLYVSTGATFASLATFSSGLSSGSTITVNNAIQVAQPAANTTALILRTRATNSNFITINATGGNVTVAPGTGVLRVTQGYGSSGTITNTSRGYLALQGTDGDASSFDVTIDPSTALSASRTLTCPNLSGTLAVVNAAQTFSSLQTFTAGITANALYVSTGATFASRPSFPSGLTTDNLWVTNGVTFAGTSVHTGLGTFNGGITANNLWVTNGATFAGQVTVTNFRAATIGGDEGGQIDFGLAATNTTLTGGVSIDIFQNKLRIFESGGTNRGAYIDLTSAGAGVASNLLSGGGTAAVSSVTGAGNGIFVSPTTGAVVVYNTGVHSVNGLTGDVTISAGSGMTSTVANTFSALQTFTAGITANAIYVSTGATFAGANLVGFTTGLTAANVYAGQVLTDSIFSRTQGSALQINYDANTITTIGDEPGNGNSTYISVDDSTGTITLSAPVGGINTSFFNNQITAPSFADTYSFCETFRTTTSGATANQTIATVPGVYDDGEIPPVMRYPAFEVTISARDTVANKTEMLKMLIVQNGTDTVNTQYGLIRTGATGPVSSYSTTLSGSPKDLLIRATPSSANSTKFIVTVRAHNG
jgi:hypothetical protein